MTSVRRWLGRISVSDPIERRQAYVLQAILLVVGVSFLFVGLNGVYLRLTANPEANPASNLGVAVIVLGLLALLRRGQFRIVAGLFVALLIVAFGLALALTGYHAGAAYFALLMVPIVIAGLLLARRWLILTAIGAYAAASLALTGDPILTDPAVTSPLGNVMFATIFITVAVDQFGGTVRRALFEAIAHETELETGREQLAARTDELQTVVGRLEGEIVERHRLEQERANIEARALESQRLESIGLLAGGVAHDFNNLLTGIIGYADLASMRFGPRDEVQEELEGIRHSAEQAAGLTRQLLAFSRSAPLHSTVVDLGDVVGNVESLLRRLLGEQIRLVVRPAPELWPVLADPSLIESVIVNLAINARDAMETGGTLTIETANVELDNDYARTHVEVEPGPYAMVAVSDTGAGMDQETLARIFEPFFTTKAMGKGTGLGLASVYGTVRQSGGHIWVYSEPGEGTTFKIYLPRTDGSPAQSTPRRPPAETRPGHELILVAEDDEAVRAMVVQALQRHGYEVLAVGTGEEALAAIEMRGGEIGVLLTDIVMPGIGGLELLERARAVRPDLRAIFMSGYTAHALDERQIPAEVVFLEKPFTLARLDEAMRSMLGA